MHLPAPHVWQVVPPGQPRSVDVQDILDTHVQLNGHAQHTNSQDHEHEYSHDLSKIDPRTTSPTLVITLSPHVRSGLSDAEVLTLTKWATSCVLEAFAKSGFGKDRESVNVEVTVGVVRA